MALLFPSADCSGSAYVHTPNAHQRMTFRGVLVGPFASVPPLTGLAMSGPGTKLYFPSGAVTQVNIASYAMSYPPGGCAGGGVPINPDLCCFSAPVGNVPVAPAAETDLGGFTPPFTFSLN